MATEGDPRPAHLRAWSASLSQEVEHLRVQLEQIQHALAEAEEKQALVQRLLELDGEVPELLLTSKGRPDTAEAASLGDGLGPAPAGSGGGQSLEDAVVSILRASGQPLHVSDIRARLIADGIRIPGRGDDANIIVRLRKIPEQFTRTARGTYALADWGLPSLDSSIGKRKRSQSRR
jgi:hypothetical protein